MDVAPADLTRLAPAPGSRLAVVGGCGGIGRALVAAARAAELKVAVLDLPASIAAHPPPEDVLTLALDATREDEVATAFAALRDAWGWLDVLVNLAGFTNRKVPVADVGADEWQEIVDGNLRAAYLSCRHALPLMPSGAIVNMASGLANRLLPGYGAYGAAKAGVIALTKALAIENAPHVRANAVAPGAVDTAFLRGGTGRGGEVEGAVLQLDPGPYVATIPLGRIAVPDDVVGPILFLAGDASRYMTGQVLHINCGSLTP